MESTNPSTPDGSVAGGPLRSLSHLKARIVFSLVWITASSVFLFGAFRWDLPYYEIAPGSAVDTSLLVDVDHAHAHPAKGKVFLTTVSLGKVTLYDALRGWLDRATDVVPERVIAPPGVNEKQFRQENLQAMDESKQKAIGVAFEALGVDAIRGKGAEVEEIVGATPAASTLHVGDVLVAIDGAPVGVDADAVRMLGAHKPGDRVRLSVVPKAGGAPADVDVTLIEHPQRAGRAFLGVSLTTKDVSFAFPFNVGLRSEQIGGPSAGLAFTLEVLDVLTPGELTGGRKVAATGTIELDGSVGEVGGVAQKTIAVRRAGATMFLVPRAEYKQAKKFAGSELDVRPVDTLSDALKVLSTVGGNGLALPKLDVETAS
jgi:PDZ domain-containing protein